MGATFFKDYGPAAQEDGCSNQQFCQAWTDYATQLQSAGATLLNQFPRCFCDIHCSTIAEPLVEGSSGRDFLTTICGEHGGVPAAPAVLGELCSPTSVCKTTYKKNTELPPPDVYVL